jgi:hypothetical protein
MLSSQVRGAATAGGSVGVGAAVRQPENQRLDDQMDVIPLD